MLSLTPLTRRSLLASGSAVAIVKPQEARAWFWVFVGGYLTAEYLRDRDERTRRAAGVTTASYSGPRRVYKVLGASPLPPADPEQPEDPLISRIAARFGGNKEVGAHILKAMGPVRAEWFLSEKIGLWSQRNGPNGPNVLHVRIHNNSMDTVRGEIEFAIDNAITRKREFTFMDDAYKLDPHGSLELEIPLRVEFQTPGPKKITVINQPPQIITPVGEMFVLPFVIQSTEV